MFGKEQFRVEPAHVALLQNSYVGWNDCESGSASIDCKRPYGNSGRQIYADMGRILELKAAGVDRYDEPEWSDEQLDYLNRLHAETETALQIFLQMGAMRPGLYEREKYVGRWEYIGE